jgi:exopolysaccharide biosynthesis WecB/TagA/CpsF family protein
MARGHDEGLEGDFVRVLGVPFHALSYEAAARRIRGMIEDGGPHHVVLANAYTLNLAYQDPGYRRILEEASLVLRDGVGVEIAAALAGASLRHNFVGTDFVPWLLASVADLRPGVFLYGAAPGVAAEAADALQARIPDLRIVGAEHGYGSRAAALQRVRTSSPHVLLVALGNPLQERWIRENLCQLNVCVAIGVGALFDYLAGRLARAPRWVRAARCEWVFRLFVEPRRLARRYLLGNPTFLWRAALSARRPAR